MPSATIPFIPKSPSGELFVVAIRAIPSCLQARQEFPKLSQRRIGAHLGINYMTVKRAFDYARIMEQLGTHDVYHELQAPPDIASRWRDRQRSC